MRKPIIVGNWKMFTNLEKATQIVSTLKEETKEPKLIIKKPKYVSINNIKNCCLCEYPTMQQRPQDQYEGWIFCSGCKKYFRIELRQP